MFNDTISGRTARTLAKTGRARYRVAIATSLLVLMSGTTRAQEADFEKIKQAAEREGKVVVYTSSIDYEMRPVKAAFEKMFPKVQFQSLRLPSATAFTRYMGERQAGAVQVDVLFTGSSALFQQNPELFVPLTKARIPNLPSSPKIVPKNDTYVVPQVSQHQVAYNTSLVSKDDLAKHLKSWKDLADPFWRGKVVLGDPKATTTHMSWLKVMRDAYGDQWVRDFAKNEPAVVGSLVLGIQQTAAGAYHIAVPAVPSQSIELLAKGAPIANYRPEGPAHGNETSMAVPKDAPHPNAGLLFIYWKLTPEAQTMLCGIGTVPTLPTTPGTDCPVLPANHIG